MCCLIMENDNKQLPADTREEIKYGWTGLFSTLEGRILIIGVGLVILYIFCLSLSFLWSPGNLKSLIAMTVTHILFGRAAAMSFGYTVNLSHIVIITLNMFIETYLVLIIYSLFVLSWRRLLVFKPLKNFMNRISKIAEKHRKTIRRYGLIGLLLFVWFPFWMTGPIVGCVIGFFLGLPVWLNLTVVLTGTYLAIFCWAFLLRKLYNKMILFSPYAPIIILIILIIIVLAGYLLQGRTAKKDAEK